MTDAKPFIEKNLNSSGEPRPPQRSPMQFSLLGMMVLTTVLAVVCAVMFALPPSFGALVCIILQPCLLAGCVVGAFTAKGDLRAFCVGTLVPFFQSITPGGGGMASWSNYIPVMLAQRSFSAARGRNNPGESIFDLIGNIFTMLERVGPTVMLMMVVFVFGSLCCGFTGVFVRRWVLKRYAESS